MISQILRDEGGMLPAKANEFAANIRRQLTTAMPTPTNQPLQGYRIISSHPPDGGSEFTAALKEKIADVNYRVAVIFIDTEVFVREKLDWNSKSFTRLRELVRSGHLSVLTTKSYFVNWAFRQRQKR